MDGLFGLYDDSCVMRGQAASLPWAGKCVGKDRLRELLGKITAHFDLTSRISRSSRAVPPRSSR